MTDKVRYSYGPDTLDHLVKVTGGKAFRKKVEPCPYCEPNCGMFQEPKFATEWDQEGIVREIVFIRKVGLYYKKGYAMRVSACPRCRKLSFHHRDISWLLRDSWADKEIVQAEIDAWEQESIDEWDKSLCKRCTVKREVEKDKYGYVVDCSTGKGGSPEDPEESTTFRCDQYIPKVPNTCFICGGVFEGDEEHPDNMHLTCSKKIKEIDRVAHEEWVEKMKELGWEKEAER